MSKTLRVVEWSTGTVGRHAIAGILARPDLELVGCWVHSEEKDGRDVGEIVGSEPLGVVATNSIEEILALVVGRDVVGRRGAARGVGRLVRGELARRLLGDRRRHFLFLRRRQPDAAADVGAGPRIRLIRGPRDQRHHPNSAATTVASELSNSAYSAACETVRCPSRARAASKPLARRTNVA